MTQDPPSFSLGGLPILPPDSFILKTPPKKPVDPPKKPAKEP